ncbi:hypothetical protein ACLMJK_000139 [Lecanora helva]
MSPFFLLALAFSSRVSLATKSPLLDTTDAPILEDRQQTNCTDLDALYFPECWDQLDIPGYLNDPRTGWNVTTPVCKPSDSEASDCCKPGEPWSNCFIRLATGHTEFDCTKIGFRTCLLSNRPPLSPTLAPSIAAKVRYVLRNIFSITYAITNYYHVLVSLQYSNEYDGLSGILKNYPTLDTGNLIKALIAGEPFWGTAPVLAGGAQGINVTFNPRKIQTITQSIERSKGVSSALFGEPLNGSDYQVQSPHDTSYLGFSTSNASTLLNTALDLIMNDVPTFLDFAAHGSFSLDSSITTGSGTKGLESAVNTYVVGQALSQNKFSATPMAKITQETFQLGRNCTSLGDVCNDSKSVVYYWSSVTNMQYQISFSGSWQQDGRAGSLQDAEGEATTFALLEYIETRSVAYMPVLFDGAYNCTLEGKAGGSAIGVNGDGTLDIACLSAVPIYLSKGSPCPQGAVFVDGKCPFGYNG